MKQIAALFILMVLTYQNSNAESQASASSPSPVIKPPSNYNKLNPDCKVCEQIDRLRQEYSEARDGRVNIDKALEIAKVIKGLSAQKGTPPALHSSIYYSIHAALEIQRSDFDDETAVWLLALRDRFKVEYDNVLWRFPRDSQDRIITWMTNVAKREHHFKFKTANGRIAPPPAQRVPAARVVD